MVERVDRDEARLRRLAPAFALADGGVEAVKDLARQQAAQLPPIAAGECGHDHLVGGARAGNEVLGVEARLRCRDGVEAGRHARAPASATSFQRSAGGGWTSTGRAAVSAGRGGKVTTLSVAGLRTASRAE